MGELLAVGIMSAVVMIAIRYSIAAAQSGRPRAAGLCLALSAAISGQLAAGVHTVPGAVALFAGFGASFFGVMLVERHVL